MCLYTADAIVILVLIFLCRKLLQVPGLIIGSGAYVGHSGILKKNSTLVSHVPHQEA